VSDNLSIWNKLGRTDPAHTKGFKRAGGFSGTAIKPIYTDQKMTEVFGPCGDGWGYSEPTFQLVPAPDGQTAVYCWLSVWYRKTDGTRSEPVHGVGGDFAVKKFSSGMVVDDEGFKKAFTDALGNAMKHLGMSADVHMGRFDDSKYVAELKREFSSQKQDQGDPDKASLEFVAACKKRIADAPDTATLAGWWNTEERKNAFRDFDLTDSECRELQQLVTARVEALKPRAVS